MLDYSIQELREFVNNYRLNNNAEAPTSNGTTRQYNNDELIMLLESDTSNTEDKQGAENCAEKIQGNDTESQGDFNVFKVKENAIQGLTVEVRENLYSKFNTALSINYKTTYNNQSVTLTNANIRDIAKKIEFSILSIATDLNSYKLSGAEKVVNIEKQTRNRNLCEALHVEIELLKLRGQIQTAESKDKPQELSSVVIVEAETILRKEFRCQYDKSNTDIAVNSEDSPCSESESDTYFSYSSSDHSPTEFQQENQSCKSNRNTQNPDVDFSKEKISKETESTIVRNCQIVSTTEIFYERYKNNCGEKNTTEINDVLSEIHSNDGKDQPDLASIEGVLLNKKRKRKSKSDEECTIQDNKENIDLMSSVADTRMANSLPSKKHKITSSEETTDTPDSTTSSEIYPLDWFPLIEDIKLESDDIKSERFSPHPNDTMCTSCNNETVSFENSLSNEIPDEKCDSLGCNEKNISSSEKIELEAEATNSEIIAQDQNMDAIVTVNRNDRCPTTDQTDISSYSSYIETKENCDEQIDVFKIENPISVDVDSSNILNDNTVLQNPDLSSENDALSSLPTRPRSGQGTEMIAVSGSDSSDVDANNDHHENNVVVKKTPLIAEEAFELEKARLDRIYEEMKKQTKESENRDFIYGDYERIFNIIIPIIREYYPSDYIPEEWSYGKILQRLQIHLAKVEMSDEEMASYTRESIKTMRYLCDHCIVQ